MLDIRFIRENREPVENAIKVKEIDLDLDELLELDKKRRKLIVEKDELRKKRKEAAKSKSVLIGKKIKTELSKVEKNLKEIEASYQELMYLVPNVPADSSPVGGEQDFKVLEEIGKRPKFDFEIKDHIELGQSLDILDIDRGVKVSGSRGYFLKNEGTLLQLGVLMLALRKAVGKGFTPVVPPTMIREFALYGSGHFPFGREEVYELEEYSKKKEKEKKFLAGTAEPSLLSYHAGETLNEKDLPIKLCGISTCYRREVGGYGKDTKGLYRVHEFTKVEQVMLTSNDLKVSEDSFMEMLQHSKDLLADLDLPYRVIDVATGDMGAGKYKMYDLETWMPSRNEYGETHSCSNLTDWQSRRLNIKYRDRAGKIQFTHALNNTVIASPRILVAILENNQQKNGSVKIPEVLQEFVGGKKKIEPKD